MHSRNCTLSTSIKIHSEIFYKKVSIVNNVYISWSNVQNMHITLLKSRIHPSKSEDLTGFIKPFMNQAGPHPAASGGSIIMRQSL